MSPRFRSALALAFLVAFSLLNAGCGRSEGLPPEPADHADGIGE